MKKIFLFIAVIISIAAKCQVVATTADTVIVHGGWTIEDLCFHNQHGTKSTEIRYIQVDSFLSIIGSYNAILTGASSDSFYNQFNQGWNAYYPLQQYLGGIAIDTTAANNSFLNH